MAAMRLQVRLALAEAKQAAAQMRMLTALMDAETKRRGSERALHRLRMRSGPAWVACGGRR
jgi:hypothetical protein